MALTIQTSQPLQTSHAVVGISGKGGAKQKSGWEPRAGTAILTEMLCQQRRLVLCLNKSLFLDAGLLTSELAQVVKLSATHLTVLLDGDALDVG